MSENKSLHRFCSFLYKVRSAKSEAILRQTNCRHKCVGTGALESPTSKRLGLDLSRMKRSRQCYKFLRQTLCKKNTNDIVTETSISGTSHFCKAEIAPLPYILIFSDTRLLNQRANAVRPYAKISTAAKSLRSLRILLCAGG